MKATAEKLLDNLKDRCRIQLEEAIRLLTQYQALTPFEYTDRATGERVTEMVASSWATFKMGSVYDCDPEPLYFNTRTDQWERATNMDDLWALARSADILLQRAKMANPRARK